MPDNFAQHLHSVLTQESANLLRLTDEEACVRPSGPASWSRKEELGHLIDSAVNNHARFVRASTEPEFQGPGYRQDDWVRLHGYHDLPWPDLLGFWRQHNTLLVHLIRRLPEEKMETPCKIGAGPVVTLRFVIEDYILHMQHHLDHILSREKMTQYPGAAL